MIRSKNKIYGEVNNPNTVTGKNSFTGKTLLQFENDTEVSQVPMISRSLVVLNSNNRVETFQYNQSDKYIGVNGSGNLELFNKTTLPLEPPSLNRSLVKSAIGGNAPDSVITNDRIIVEPGWYEIILRGGGGGGGGGCFINSYAQQNGRLAVPGSNGGNGAVIHIKVPIAVTSDLSFTLGNGGGGGGALSITKNGMTYTFNTNTCDAGDGGFGYNNSSDIAFDGADTNVNTFNDLEAEGGTPSASGTNGGNVTVIPPNNIGVNRVITLGAGGGASTGLYGGKGASSSIEYMSEGGAIYAVTGGAGGAGGSIGRAGNGGDTFAVIPKSGSNSLTKLASGGIGYSGGGGGAGSTKYIGETLITAGQSKDYILDNLLSFAGGFQSGSGGGGGGLSYLTIGDITLIAAGGGGGAGGYELSVVPTSSISIDIENGGNGEQPDLASVIDIGGVVEVPASITTGGKGGANLDFTKLSDGISFPTGYNGAAGYLEIWRLT